MCPQPAQLGGLCAMSVVVPRSQRTRMSFAGSGTHFAQRHTIQARDEGSATAGESLSPILGAPLRKG